MNQAVLRLIFSLICRCEDVCNQRTYFTEEASFKPIGLSQVMLELVIKINKKRYKIIAQS